MIHIFFFLSFYDIDIGNDHFDYLGNTIYQIPQASLQSDYISDSWYFIQFPYLDKGNCKEKLIKENGLSLDSDSIITSRICLAFLSRENISTLQLYYKSKREKINIQFLKSSEKLHNTKNKLESSYIARFHDNFVPPQNLRGNLTKLSKDVYLYATPRGSTEDNLNEILAIPQLRSISPQERPQLLNRWNSGLTQKNEWPGGYDISNGNLNVTEILSKGDLRVNRYFNDRGLNGTGQTITIVDSGLDLTSPYFREKSDTLFEFEKVYPNRRKVVYYTCYGNDHDSRDMHGTHVAGIVSGNPTFSEEIELDKLSLYNGVAPGSKLAIVDITENDDTGTVVLNYPAILLGEVIGRVDSKIALCSWGTPSNAEQSYYFDMLAETNPNRLFVFAAGNNGPNYMTVTTPGDGKNVLTVGALDPLWTSHYETMRVYMVNMKHEVKALSIGKDLFYDVPNFLLRDVKTVTSLTDILNNGDKAVFVTDSPDFCDVLSKSDKIPTAVIFIGENFNEPSDTTFSFPIFTSNDTEILSYKTVTITVTLPSSEDNMFDLKVAQYSSRGPNYVGIQKPDVVAPGTNVYSADSTFVSSSSGTSNAAAYVAGSAVLVYEYFERGFYPTGSEVSTNSFVPTSDLVRALIVASADPLPTTVENGKRRGSRTPDSLSGHGLVNLHNVVTFGRNMKVFKQVKVGNDEHFFMRFTLKKSEMNDMDLRICSAYKDSSSTNNYLALQTNIDMYLVLPNGTIVYGNHRPGDVEERFSTVERILIYNEELRELQKNSNNESDTYELHFVTGGGFSTLPHYGIFSLLISGPFVNNEDAVEDSIKLYETRNFLYEFEEPEDLRSDFKFYLSYKETCEFPSFGVKCQHNATEIPIGNQTLFEIPSSTAKLLYVNIPLNYTRMLLHLRREPSFNGRLALQFAINNIYEYGTNYPFIVSVNGGSSTIALGRSMFGANKFVGIRMSNMVGTDLKVSASMTYEEAIPAQTPTRSAEATIPKEVIVHLSVSYGLFALFLIPVIVFSILICCLRKKIKNGKKLTLILHEDNANDQENDDINDNLLKENAL